MATPLLADEHNFEQHGLHVHGEVRLMIAQDGDQLEIDLVSPGVNMVGFEHPPSTQAQKEAINGAIATLKQPLRLFGFPSAAVCKAISVEAQISKEHHDEHENHDEHDEPSGHSEFSASYHLDCAKISQLDRIEINLFKLFPATKVIDVQSITDRGQQKMDLTEDNATLKF